MKLNKEKIFKPKMASLSQKWLDILVPFGNEYNKSFTGSEISRITGIPQRTTSRYMIELVKDNILRIKESGNNKFYYLDLSNEKIKIILNLIESYKSFKFSRNTLLWKDIKELIDFGTLVLFGSHVKGYYTKLSDIDLVIFSNNTKKLRNILRDFPKIQAQIISFESFEKLVDKKDILALEILKNHVIFGDLDKFINISRRFYSE